MSQINAATNILAAIKDPYLIVSAPNNEIKIHRINNWGTLLLNETDLISSQYPDFFEYVDLIKNILLVSKTNIVKYLTNYKINDKYLSGIFNINIIPVANDRIMILTSKTDVVELNGNIVPISQIKEMRDSFTASIGHELRTPLTSILSMIELLKFTEMTSKQKD
jgi:signal transduction histidine kinase